MIVDTIICPVPNLRRKSGSVNFLKTFLKA